MAWDVAHKNKRAHTLRPKCQHCDVELDFVRREDNPEAIKFPATYAPHECRKRSKREKRLYKNPALGRMG